MGRGSGIVLAGLLLGAAQGEPVCVARLDGSQAFFHAAVREGGDGILATTTAGPLTLEMYQRYAVARLGPRHLQDLAFELALEAECSARGLAASAPTLARTVAAQRQQASGRDATDDALGSRRLAFVNDALRQQRIDALVLADRVVDETEVRAMFERQYGPGGRKEQVRHALVSTAATARRLSEAGRNPTADEIETAMQLRVGEWRARLSAGVRFDDLLAESDDARTARELADPERRDTAGELSLRDQQELGPGFGAAIADLEVGAVSGPLRTERGLHLVEVLARELVRYDDVAAELRRVIGGGPATASEERALRRELLTKYEYAPR